MRSETEKSHPRTNTNLGEFLTTFRGIGLCRFSLNARHQGNGPYGFLLKVIWTNGSQISPKVLVYTDIGP